MRLGGDSRRQHDSWLPGGGPNRSHQTRGKVKSRKLESRELECGLNLSAKPREREPREPDCRDSENRDPICRSERRESGRGTLNSELGVVRIRASRSGTQWFSWRRKPFPRYFFEIANGCGVPGSVSLGSIGSRAP